MSFVRRFFPRRVVFALMLLVVALMLSGCRTLSFYAQALKGQYQLIASQRPVRQLLQDPQTSPELKQRLQVLLEVRDFAEQQLHLPADGHYLKYADLHRPFVVLNVEAAPEFSMEPKSWWYPLVGSLDYRGYFSEKGAHSYGAVLKAKGYDVYYAGASAYSTLGWFKDPALSTFIFDPDPDLAETIFHELGHQRVFARGDTDFNEAFATTVGQEGAKRWLRARRSPDVLAQYEAALRRNDEFVHLIMGTRSRLEALYGDERDEDGKLKHTKKQDAVPRDELRAQKQRLLADLRDEYSRLKEKWGGIGTYDQWFARPINNAKLNSVAAYYDLVPGFEEMLAQEGADLEKFYAAAEKLSKMDKKQRRELLGSYAKSRTSSAAVSPAPTDSREHEHLAL